VIQHLPTIALAFALAFNATVRAQDKPAEQPPARTPPVIVPLKIQVVVSRYQGEKKISSLPYTLSVTAGSRASLRMGAQVPVMMAPAPVADGQKTPQSGPFQYKDVGTNIDCTVAQPMDEGRFRVDLIVDDSSIYPDGSTASTTSPGSPSFRQFRASDSMILKDGQTSQFTAATDKVNGETVKVDVTLTVSR
jgi:hypothetical protein